MGGSDVTIRMMLAPFILLSLSAQSASPSKNLVENGSFEFGDGPPTHKRSIRLGEGFTNVHSWLVVSGNVDWNGPYYRAYEGVRSLDLSGDQPGQVAQTISTVPGREYLLTFWLSGNPEGQPLKTMEVRVGQAVHKFSYDTAKLGAIPTDQKWRRHSFTFKAESEETRITLASTTPGHYGPFIDQVEVSRQP